MNWEQLLEAVAACNVNGATDKELRTLVGNVQSAIDEVIGEDGKNEIPDDKLEGMETLVDFLNVSRIELETRSARQRIRDTVMEDRRIRSEGTGRRTSPENARRTNNVTNVRERIEDDPMVGYPEMDRGGAIAFMRDVRTASRPGSRAPERLTRALAVMSADAPSGPDDFSRGSVGEEGGYLSPPAMRDEIWRYVFEVDSILQRIALEPTNGRAVFIDRDETTPWGSSGITAKWVGEGGRIGRVKPKVAKDLVHLHKLAVLVPGTDELISDAPRFNNLITEKAGAAIRWMASDSLLNGNGVAQPLGILNSGALITQAKENDQTADTIKTENIVKMFSRMLFSAGMSGAFWAHNPDTIPQLFTVTLANQPLFIPPGGLPQAPAGTLLGLPLQPTESAKTLGDLGDLVLINPSGYYGTRHSDNLKFASSIHVWFDFDSEAFKWTFRMGGQPYARAPVTPPNSTQTQSHFVALAARD